MSNKADPSGPKNPAGPTKKPAQDAFYALPLSEETRNHVVAMLVDLYHMAEKQVRDLDDAKLLELLRKREQEKLGNVKNPNAFWILSALPPPPVVKPTTSKKAGVWVIIALVAALLAFLAMALCLALLL